MALSAMDELEPPGDQWDRIEASLPGSGSEAAGVPADARDGSDAARADRRGGRTGADSRSPGTWIRDIGWLRAAAGIVLFAGGLGLGSLLGPLPGAGGGSTSDGAAEAAAGTPDRPPVAATAGETAGTGATSAASGARRAGEPESGDTDEILRRLESLGSGEIDAREAYRNPTAAAERLARLDALVRAAREALEEDPADPAMNRFLFRVVEERQQLNQALHLASIDYR